MKVEEVATVVVALSDEVPFHGVKDYFTLTPKLISIGVDLSSAFSSTAKNYGAVVATEKDVSYLAHPISFKDDLQGISYEMDRIRIKKEPKYITYDNLKDLISECVIVFLINNNYEYQPVITVHLVVSDKSPDRNHWYRCLNNHPKDGRPISDDYQLEVESVMYNKCEGSPFSLITRPPIPAIAYYRKKYGK